MLSPLTEEGVNVAYWLDRNGDGQIYWDGANYGQHVCSCHFSDDGCIEEETYHNTCNCDSNVPTELFDEGKIMNASALPITELRFGGLSYDGQKGFHTLGKLVCKGIADFPKAISCSALKRSGQFKSGYYNVEAEGGYSKLVHCDMGLPGYNDENSEHSVTDEKVASLDERTNTINDEVKDLENFKIDKKYCVFANGDCPTGFTRYEGHHYGIRTWSCNSKEVTFGNSFFKKENCGHDGGDGNYVRLAISACCK